MQHPQLPATASASLHPPQAAPDVLTATLKRGDERLGYLPPGHVTAPLTPGEIAAVDAQAATWRRHSARMNAAHANAQRSDAAILARRDAEILSTLQDEFARDYADLTARLLGPESRYQVFREMGDIAFATGPTQAPLALGSALAATSALVAPHTRIRHGRHSMPVTLLVAAPAPSGAGKDAALQTARGILMAAGRGCAVAEKLASPQALEEAVAATGEVFLLQDEFGTPAGGGGKAALLGTVIDYYSRSGKPAPLRRKASPKAGTASPATVQLSGLLMGTPRNFLRELSPELMASGLANRLLMLPALTGEDLRRLEALTPGGGEIAASPETLTRNLTRKIELALRAVEVSPQGKPQQQAAQQPAVSGGVLEAATSQHPPPGGVITLHLEDTPEVDDLLWQVSSFQRHSHLASDPVYARVREMALKVAAILQRARCLLTDPHNAVIDAGDLADALELVTLSCQMLGRVSHARGGGIVGLAEELWNWLRRQPGEGATQSDFRAKNRRAPYREEAESWLREQRLTRLTPNYRGGGFRVEAVGEAFPAP